MTTSRRYKKNNKNVEFDDDDKEKRKGKQEYLITADVKFFFVFVHFLCVMHQLQPLLIFCSERSK